MNNTTKPPKQPFSFYKRLKSFEYAFQGVVAVFRNEHNMLIHLFATCIAIVFSILLHISSTEWLAVMLSIGFVWTAEIFNTAIEKTMDFITTEKKPAIKLIKDLSAAAVLIASITALIVGCFIFIPKI